MINKNDISQITSMGIEEKELNRQLECFENGLAKVNLLRHASAGDGILVLNETKQNHYKEFYDSNRNNYTIIKFVPASGAASRMFKDLYTFKNKFDVDKDKLKEFTSKNDLKSVFVFFEGLEKFAFYSELIKSIEKDKIDLSKLSENEKYITILDYLLTEKGLNYGNKPKGVLGFHFYQTQFRTAVAEHLVEGARHITQKNKIVNIHFTISKNHRKWFEDLVEKRKNKYEKEFNIKYNVTYSYQQSSTDTIAMTLDKQIFRDDAGKIVFRPGGHGSLIKNLNLLEQDIIFIKNIDNVIPDYLKEMTIRYKKILGGILINLNNVVKKYQSRLSTGDYTIETINSIEDFMEKKLYISMPDDYEERTFERKIRYIKKILNRPLRVCGMVQNEGEPGGGPFWVKDEDNNVSLQIIESSQVDMSNEEQKKIVSKSTYFNPVDIVCTFKDWRGRSLDLDKFVNPNLGFIAEKSIGEKKIKVLERPGLWNGGMAYWNTIFVEVPVDTFNPVKTVNDLLRPEHQKLIVMNEA